MTKPPAGERLAQAAFDLFDERGFEQTTVDDITDRAGLGRATFFRHYRSKDDVIFPDHDRMLNQVRERLQTASRHTARAAVSNAVRLVLLHYVDEGDLARRRYALTSTVPALRDREIAAVARYQRLFREFIAGWMDATAEPALLRAELTAAAVVAAHNHVLRRWLRAQSADPGAELDEAMRLMTGLLADLEVLPEGHATADVCDESGPAAAVCAARLCHYGARRRFSGQVATVRCFEDNTLVRAALGEAGAGRVLVVDGGSSLGTALMGDNIADLAVASGWSGVIINGAVRDAAQLRAADLGILALGTNPRRSGKTGEGAAGEPVTFGGVTFSPGDLVYADEDGVVVLHGADPGRHGVVD